MGLLQQMEQLDKQWTEIKEQIHKLYGEPHVGDVVKLKDMNYKKGIVLIAPNKWDNSYIVLTGDNMIVCCSEIDDMVMTDITFPEIEQIKELLK